MMDTHILIVDDETLARRRLHTLLADCVAGGGARYSVSEAAHAAEAMAQLSPASAGRAVDVVLLDIHMPGQDGLALAPHIQQ
jgi:two-component system response regulator AlgR